ncbi:unnamed protein product, partial [marine sediment metagenome]
DEALGIRSLKRFIADWELNNKAKSNIKPVKQFKEKVAIIGAGPGGLSAAYFLARQGYKPTVFEGTWEEIDNGAFTGDTLNIDWVVKKVACSQCSIACDHLARVPKTHPEYPNLVASIDVEMCYSFGSNMGNSDWPTVFKCVQLCDDLG